MLSTGKNASRGSAVAASDMPSLPQCLPLEPITLANQKYTRSGELRKVLRIPPGNTVEDQSFGVAHSKPSPSLATEELNIFKESLLSSSKKARSRNKKLCESISKLDKYRGALSSKKRQHTDLLSSERPGGTNLSKMGSQINGETLDVATRRLEDGAKSAGMNKRVRTSMVEVRVQGDGWSTSISRPQMGMDNQRNMLRDGSGGSVHIEENIRRLPAGGEGWDIKMKKKRSVGAVVNRVLNTDSDMKQAMHLKVDAATKLRSCDDAHNFRSKSSPGISGNTKFDSSIEPDSSNACAKPRVGLESVPVPKEHGSALDQRILSKRNVKTNINGDNQVSHTSMVKKGKVTRAPRTCSVSRVDSYPDVHPSPGAPEGCELPTSVNKASVLGVANNHKRLSSNSSSRPVAQWSGQGPHKLSRTRDYLASPVSEHIEAKNFPRGSAGSDVGARNMPKFINGSTPTPVSTVDKYARKFKMEIEKFTSRVTLSESEESGVGENKLKEKGTDKGEVALSAVHKVGATLIPTRKKKMLNKGEIEDGLQRPGRTLSLTMTGIPHISENLENPLMEKSLQSTRRASDQINSKSRRLLLKKMTDGKTSALAGPGKNSGFSIIADESGDDHEELLAAANSSSCVKDLACSSPFWKKVESLFASVSSEDTSYLKKQLHSSEELGGNLSQMSGDEFNVLGVSIHKDVDSSFGERQESYSNEESAVTNATSGRINMGRRLDKVPPLYQRVLSAFITEDEIEEYYQHSEGKNMPVQYTNDDSHCGSFNHVDVEHKEWERMEYEVESNVGLVTQLNCSLDRPCVKSAASNPLRNPSLSNSLYNNEYWQRDGGFSHADVGFISEICQNDLDGLQCNLTNVSGISSLNCQYQQMHLDERLLLELQSIGLNPETLPDLAEEEEDIDKDILQLKKGLYQQVEEKKRNLGEIDKAIKEEKDLEQRNLQHVAMNQLTEIAYKKTMACGRSKASRSLGRKVSKQADLAFVNRTLARCQKLETTGRSCFTEPPLRDVIFSAPLGSTEVKSIDNLGSGTASNTYNESCNHQTEAMGSATGADFSTLKRQYSYNDNLDGGSSDATQAISPSSEQTFSRSGAKLNKGKKKGLILDDVIGSTSSRAVPPALGSAAIGGVRKKRSGRERDLNKDILASNSASRAGHQTSGSFRNERKTKTKLKQKTKQKTNQSLTTGIELHGRITKPRNSEAPSVRVSTQPVGANDSNEVRREAGVPSSGGISKEAEKPIDMTNLELDGLDKIEELGVSNDFNSFFTGVNDDFDCVGLEIPMDDLTDVLM